MVSGFRGLGVWNLGVWCLGAWGLRLQECMSSLCTGFQKPTGAVVPLCSVPLSTSHSPDKPLQAMNPIYSLVRVFSPKPHRPSTP